MSAKLVLNRHVSDTGGMKDEKLAAFAMIPAKELYELAEHFGKGSLKYPTEDGVDNWRRGYSWSKSFSALQRHAWNFWRGNRYDEDGNSHLIAVAWHALVLAHYLDNDQYKQYDDRQG